MNNLKSFRSQFFRSFHTSVMQRKSGSEGAIREAGGAFSKREAAQEEQYFRKLSGDQLKQLKNTVNDEISFHEGKIEEHQEALEKAKKRLQEIEKK